MDARQILEKQQEPVFLSPARARDRVRFGREGNVRIV